MTVASARVSFTVSSLDCIACTPIFQRKLSSLQGITSVKPLPMFNKIVVEFAVGDISEERVKEEVRRIAEKANLAGKMVFER